MSLAFDVKAEKWLTCWKLNSMANPQYHEMLLKYFKSLCFSLGRVDLVEELDRMVNEKIEKRMGANFQAVVMVYNNLPSLNSMTRSRNTLYPRPYVYKYEMKAWLDEIVGWIFQMLVEMEPEIRFRDSQKIM